MTSATSAGGPSLAGINPRRLFLGSCIALISTSVTFAVVAATMFALKAQFKLTNEAVGYIAGAATWGFTLSIFVLGPLCDALGMRRLLYFAFLCHLVGPLMMILTPTLVGDNSQSAFWLLFFGGLITSLGNGTVEAACNPLVATIFPNNKTKKLNQFHMWFPGGIVLGGVAAFLIDKANLDLPAAMHTWQLKLALILLPTLVYGVLFVGQKFPATERVQSGISFGGMFKATFGRLLFWVLLFCMCITASMELGPNRWIPAVLQAGGLAGILVLAYINGLMAVLRYFAGTVVHRLSNTGLLVISAILAGVGLLWLSYTRQGADATTVDTVMTVAAATVFAVGVCYFWPTMLGTVSERVPKGGSLALAMMGGMGMLAVGMVTTPQMGSVADRYLHEQLVAKQGDTVSILAAAKATYTPLLAAPPRGVTKPDLQDALAKIDGVLDKAAKTAALPAGDTANALRAAVANGPAQKTEVLIEKPAAEAKTKVEGLLNPADNYGGKMSFRWVAPFSAIIVLIFLVLYLQDRRKGGYKAEKIVATGLAEGLADGVPPDQLRK